MSIVIPVWDSPYAGYLPRAVASVRAQDPASAIVVVDNASSVEVPALAGTNLIRSPGRVSAGAARNLGLQHVTTDLVVFLDADDELAEGALEILCEGIVADPQTSVFAMSLIEADTRKRHRTPRWFVAPLARIPRLLALSTALWSLYPTQGCTILRTAWVRQSGGYGDSNGGEDWVLAVSQAFRGRVVIEPRPGLIYHRGERSLWRSSTGTRDRLAAARRVRARLTSDPAVPRWVRATRPAIAVIQFVMIVVVRPVYRGARALLRAGSALLGVRSPRIARR